MEKIQFKKCTNPNCIHGDDLQPIENFCKDKSRKSGYSDRCKDCIRIRNHEYLNSHREENKRRSREYYQKNHEKILEQEKYKRDNNKEFYRLKSKKYREEHKNEKAQRDRIYRNSPVKYDTRSDNLNLYDEIRRDPENPELLQVKCKNSKCQKWFNPTYDQVHHRLYALDHLNMGESNFYCCEECKRSCPLYKLRYDPINSNNKCSHDDALQRQLREIVFEKDQYTCQKCGRNQQEEPELVLYCHHLIPLSQDISLASDINNCITLCDICHNNYHTNKNEFPECTYGFLSQISSSK